MKPNDETMLMRLLHGELDGATAASWHARLDAEPSLRARYEALRTVWSSMDPGVDQPPVVVSAGWRRRLRHRLGHEARGRQPPAPRWVRFGAAAALVGGVVVGLGAGRGASETDPALIGLRVPTTTSLAEIFWDGVARVDPEEDAP